MLRREAVARHGSHRLQHRRVGHPAGGDLSLDHPEASITIVRRASGHVATVPQKSAGEWPEPASAPRDVPRAGDIAANPLGAELRHRDVIDVCGRFAQWGLDVAAEAVVAERHGAHDLVMDAGVPNPVVRLKKVPEIRSGDTSVRSASPTDPSNAVYRNTARSSTIVPSP